MLSDLLRKQLCVVGVGELVCEKSEFFASCCKLHRSLDSSLLGEGGCSMRCIGSHPAIRAASAVPVSHVCVVEDGVRELDRRVVCDALGLVAGGRTFGFSAMSLGWRKKYATGGVLAMSSFGAGYCPLLLVEPYMRMRVARILGPLPLIADVLRVLFVACLSMVEPMELVETTVGAYHLQLSKGTRERKKVPVDGIVLELLSVMVSSGGMARVGLEPGWCSCPGDPLGLALKDQGWSSPLRVQREYYAGLECALCEREVFRAALVAEVVDTDLLVVSRELVEVVAEEETVRRRFVVACENSGLVVWPVCRVSWEFVEKFFADNGIRCPKLEVVRKLVRLSGRGTLGSSVFSVARAYHGASVEKQWCSACLCVVNPVGHVERCRPVNSGSGFGVMKTSGWSDLRLLAWVGDTLLKVDVQVGLLLCHVPGERLDQCMQSLISNANLARYWSGLGSYDGLDMPSGTSEHSLATAFEANYFGEFRSQFLRSVDWSKFV